MSIFTRLNAFFFGGAVGFQKGSAGSLFFICVLADIITVVSGLSEDLTVSGKGENRITDAIEEITVMGDGDDTALEFVKVVFKNF